MTIDPHLRGSTADAAQEGQPAPSPSSISLSTGKTAHPVSNAHAAQGSSGTMSHAASTSSTDPLVSLSTSDRPAAAPAAATTTKRVPQRKSGFSKSEDAAILQGVELHGRVWEKVSEHFAKAAPEHYRSSTSIRQRYYHFLADGAREKKAKAVRSGGRKVQPQPQQQSESVGDSTQTQAQDQNAASPASPISSSSIVTPPLPTINPITAAGPAWTSEQERQLFRIALHHQAQDCVQTREGAIHKDFCDLFLSAQWSFAQVQLKARQLLQLGLGDVEEEEELEEGEIREEISGVHRQGERYGEAQDVSFEPDQAGGGREEGNIAAFEAHPAANEEAAEHEGGATADSLHDDFASTSSMAEQAGSTSTRAPHVPRESPTRAAPLYPSVTEQHAVGRQPPPPPAALPSFDHDVKTLPNGLRFENMSPHCKVSLFPPDKYRMRRLAPSDAAAGAAMAAAQGVLEEEQAEFVFHVLADRSVVGVKLPPRTQTHMEVVPVSGREVGVEGGYIAESHFDAESGFKVVFAVGL